MNNENINTGNNKLRITDATKHSQLRLERSILLMELNSRYGAYGHIEPSLEQQRLIHDRIAEINKELKNI